MNPEDGNFAIDCSTLCILIEQLKDAQHLTARSLDDLAFSLEHASSLIVSDLSDRANALRNYKSAD